ncbi:MAG: cytidine deaminase [Chloroflexota bacterium]
MNEMNSSADARGALYISEESIKSAIETFNMSVEETIALRAALKARNRAYAPYSQFKVGSALLTVNGEIYAGCNVESSVYTLTTHAEGLALDNMILGGGSDPALVAVVMESSHGEAMPCGVCRQKLSEFSSPDLAILGVRLEKGAIAAVYRTTLGQTLPNRFGAEIEKRSR